LYENPFIGIRVVACGWTDRHGESKSRFLQFGKRAQNGAVGQPIG